MVSDGGSLILTSLFALRPGFFIVLFSYVSIVLDTRVVSFDEVAYLRGESSVLSPLLHSWFAYKPLDPFLFGNYFPFTFDRDSAPPRIWSIRFFSVSFLQPALRSLFLVFPPPPILLRCVWFVSPRSQSWKRSFPLPAGWPASFAPLIPRDCYMTTRFIPSSFIGI